MIVAETSDGYRFVTQPDHAGLVGQFADHWGNDAVEPLEPSPSVATAAHVHDDGWWAYDRRPHLDDDGTPENFPDIPPEPWISLYDEGIDLAIELDAYTGLLVSMHGAGLRRQRYGLSPSWPETPPEYADFVDRQESRQRSLAREVLEDPECCFTADDFELLASLHDSGEPSADADSRLWRNYRLLQAWDSLSLSFCTSVSTPTHEEFGSVPGGSGPDDTLTVEALDGDVVGVDPYPFDLEPLDVHVATRTVEEPFDDDAELVRAYYESPLETETITLRRGDGESRLNHV